MVDEPGPWEFLRWGGGGGRGEGAGSLAIGYSAALAPYSIRGCLLHEAFPDLRLGQDSRHKLTGTVLSGLFPRLRSIQQWNRWEERRSSEPISTLAHPA